MRIPEGMTEDEVMIVIDRVVNRFVRKFPFGCYDRNDIRQQARMIAVDGMDRYDASRPLENFLQVHINFRLINFKRNNFERPNKPCIGCKHYDPKELKTKSQCLAFEDKMECKLWNSWVTRNTAKRNLMRPIDLSEVVIDSHEQFVSDNNKPDDYLIRDELKNLIDRLLPMELREDYLKMIGGMKLSKNKQMVVRNAITTILRQERYGEEDD